MTWIEPTRFGRPLAMLAMLLHVQCSCVQTNNCMNVTRPNVTRMTSESEDRGMAMGGADFVLVAASACAWCWRLTPRPCNTMGSSSQRRKMLIEIFARLQFQKHACAKHATPHSLKWVCWGTQSEKMGSPHADLAMHQLEIQNF